jgi:type II secretion system protein N
MAVDWNVWKRRLGYGAFAVAAFLLALRQTLPVEAFKERLVAEAALRGWQLDAAGAAPAGLVGVALEDATLKDKAGVSLQLDELDVTVSPWRLLAGRRRVSIEARLWEGRAGGTFDLGGQGGEVDLRLDGLDLARAVALRAATGLDLEGVLSGAGRLALPADGAGRTAGRLDLSVRQAALAGGKLPVPGTSDGLTLPRLGLGEVVASLELKDGRAVFQKLAATGGDATVTGEGISFVVQPNLEAAPLFGKLSLKVPDAFAQKPENRGLKALLDATLGSSRDASGAFQLQVYGSLGHPQVRALPGRG